MPYPPRSLASSLCWLALAVLVVSPPVPGQEPSPAELPEPEEPLPGVHEVVPRYLELVGRVEGIEGEIDELAVVGDLEDRIDEVESRHQDLTRRSADLNAETYPHRQRVSQLRDVALLQRRDLTALSDQVSGRLQRLGEIRSDFQERLDFWQRWREALVARGELGGVEEELANALRRIRGVLDTADDAFRTVVELQRRLEILQRGHQELLDRIDAYLKLGRQRLLERDAPPLVSREFVASLGRQTWTEPATGLRPVARLGPELLRDLGWVLLLQVLLAILVAGLIRRIRHREQVSRRWSGILEHPWAVGVFVATAILSPLYQPLPSWWELVLVTVVAVSGSVLASDLFAQRAKRRAVYALAAFYPLFLAAELLALPDPWLRSVLVVVAVLGAVAGWRMARRLPTDRGLGNRGFVLLLRLGSGLLAVAAIGETAGYDRLARWLVESSVATAFVIFVTTFLVRLVRGGVQALVYREVSDRLRFLRRVGHYLATRLTWLLQAVVVVGAGLYVLDLWQVVPAPLVTLDWLLGAGVPPADPVVTLGQVLIAALAIYLSLVVSRVLRALLDTEVIERREFDPGLGDSIQTLLHYAVATLGFLVALAILGVSLQNFAIVAGALGVGIGFGLQNIVNNFVSGLILLFERPVRAGDVVVIGGEWATVKKIGMRSTVVTTFDRSEIIVPNSDLISEKVTNWTLSDKVARIVIPLGVAYGSDLEAVFRILRQVVDADEKVLRDPEPVVHFVGFGDSSLSFEIRIWVAEIQERFDVRSDVLAEIDRRFREAGITIPFPQRDLHVRTLPEGRETETR